VLEGAPQIRSFLVKIASRCNLACDYCYVYEHADQTWRQQPRVMSAETRRHTARRIGEYARTSDIREFVVVFHGGEPLLAGAEPIAETVGWIRDEVGEAAKVEFCLQTNGTLISEQILDVLEIAGVSVSLSIDGPKRANDLHRLDHAGRSSFGATIAGLEQLENRPKVYSGLISVVDPRVRAEEVLAFVAPRRPPRFDFLLPDANHERPPPGRADDPDLYINWLIDAFDAWFERFATLPVRLFEEILAGLAGLPSGTDAFGFGDVSLLTIETDGSYHDLDVLKITKSGATALEKHVTAHSIAEVAATDMIANHRGLLRRSGLAPACQVCPVVDVCAGGSVPHRYSRDGFLNPTVYCREMLALIGHARRRLDGELKFEFERTRIVASNLSDAPVDLRAWADAATGSDEVSSLRNAWSRAEHSLLLDLLGHIARKHPNLKEAIHQIIDAPAERVERLAIEPAVALWTSVTRKGLEGIAVHCLDGKPIAPMPDYVWHLAAQLREPAPTYPRVHQDEPWLRHPFGTKILFEPQGNLGHARGLLNDALRVIAHVLPELAEEVRSLNSDIQFVTDAAAHPDKAVSFSDNCVPGALYVSIRTASGFIDPLLLAESIIHEHRHQKLYLLQRVVTLVEDDSVRLPSPWREDPRPPSGLLHALFVFVQLREYWTALRSEATDGAICARCDREVLEIASKLESGFATLRAAPLTLRGRELATLLETQFRHRGLG
jgi:uncharacterized protein